MIGILFRAFSTVVTVIIAVSVASILGDTAKGKLVAALLIAVAIALVEWLLIWAPRHSSAARRILDPRAIFVGIWLQQLKQDLSHGENIPASESNEFAIFWVEFQAPDGYSVRGFAYNPKGKEHAVWSSDGSPEFAKNGRSMIYRWTGTNIEDSGDAPNLSGLESAARSGITSITLDTAESGTGQLTQLRRGIDLLFGVQAITADWLKHQGSAVSKPESFKNAPVRNQFALHYATKLHRA